MNGTEARLTAKTPALAGRYATKAQNGARYVGVALRDVNASADDGMNQVLIWYSAFSRPPPMNSLLATVNVVTFFPRRGCASPGRA